jgi:hypothetical protein
MFVLAMMPVPERTEGHEAKQKNLRHRRLGASPLAKAHAVNPEAHEAYLKGR